MSETQRPLTICGARDGKNPGECCLSAGHGGDHLRIAPDGVRWSFASPAATGERRVIQLVAHPEFGLYALCDDGSIWQTSELGEWSHSNTWARVPYPPEPTP